MRGDITPNIAWKPHVNATDATCAQFLCFVIFSLFLSYWHEPLPITFPHAAWLIWSFFVVALFFYSLLSLIIDFFLVAVLHATHIGAVWGY